MIFCVNKLQALIDYLNGHIFTKLIKQTICEALPCDTGGWTARRLTAKGERLPLVDGTDVAAGRGARVADVHLQKGL